MTTNYPPAPNYTAPHQPTTGKGLATSALIVGIVAFALGLIPIFGALVGLAAIVLAVLALIKKQHKTFSLIGLILGALATITSIAMIFGLNALTNNTSNNTPVTVSEEEQTTTEEPEPEPAEVTGPSDEERAATFDRELKDIFFIEDSYQEIFAQDPTMWVGWIADVRAEGPRIYITMQVDRHNPEGEQLGKDAAQALSTLMSEEFVNKLDYDWIIVEDGAGIVIDQKQPNPLM